MIIPRPFESPRIHSLESSRTIFWVPSGRGERGVRARSSRGRYRTPCPSASCCSVYFCRPRRHAAPVHPAPGNPIVDIETSMGTITVELFKDQAPVSVANFLEYVRDGFYPGTVLHRVVPGYVIQGGGFTSALVEKGTRPPIQNEATNGLSNRRGTLAMARTRSLRSATSQFYINLSNNPLLDHTGFSPGRLRLRRLRPGHRRHGRRRSHRPGEDRLRATAWTTCRWSRS